ncbi:uncharacterized protein LOC108115128 isoform X2 [Drosophila eugracilis]|uniref:uncharacterized protein LOC108115128 isoform X2 n=1 Tax=Drosophila eugracilis TaxID=29029 RepID=UPI0007E7401B|nr:uncharacterized protein LOC108115128 isoform X2 [Drosophila eugracilis]
MCRCSSSRYHLVANRRGGKNLIFQGYMYCVERKYRNSINWVCSKNSNHALRCPARCVTNPESTSGIKLSHRHHNHPAYSINLNRRRPKRSSKNSSNQLTSKSGFSNCSQRHTFYRENGFMIIDGYRFVIGTTNQRRTYLKCANFRSSCRARAIVNRETNNVRMRHDGHNHSRKNVPSGRSSKNLQINWHSTSAPIEEPISFTTKETPTRPMKS